MIKNRDNTKESNEQKRIEEAKNTAMSKERKAITDLFSGFKFEIENFNNKK